MWHSPKRLFAAGALLVLAGTHSPAQDPTVGSQEDPPVLPAPAEQIRPLTGPGIAPMRSTSIPTQDPVEVLPPPAKQHQPVTVAAPSPACPVAPGTDGAAYRTHAHPPLLAYRKDYQSPPVGLMMHEHFQIQVNNGIAARMVLHEYDFICGSEKLNLRGSDHLRQISQFWRSCNYPLIIERTPYAPGLAQARRTAVLKLLAEQGIGVPPELVVIGPSPAVPLRGLEAEFIYKNLIQQTQNRGNLPGQSAFPGGGTSVAIPGAGTTGTGTIGASATGGVPQR